MLVAMAGCVTIEGQLTMEEVVDEIPYGVGNDAASIGSRILAAEQ
jgi:hypothetical protein